MTSSPILRMPLLRGLSPKPAHPLRKEESRTWRSSSPISASQDAARFPAASHGGDVRGAPSWSHNSEDQAPEPQARGSRSIQELTRAPPPAGGPRCDSPTLTRLRLRLWSLLATVRSHRPPLFYRPSCTHASALSYFVEKTMESGVSLSVLPTHQPTSSLQNSPHLLIS